MIRLARVGLPQQDSDIGDLRPRDQESAYLHAPEFRPGDRINCPLSMIGIPEPRCRARFSLL
jgi:hypothetical protein